MFGVSFCPPTTAARSSALLWYLLHNRICAHLGRRLDRLLAHAHSTNDPVHEDRQSSPKDVQFPRLKRSADQTLCCVLDIY